MIRVQTDTPREFGGIIAVAAFLPWHWHRHVGCGFSAIASLYRRHQIQQWWRVLIRWVARRWLIKKKPELDWITNATHSVVIRMKVLANRHMAPYTPSSKWGEPLLLLCMLFSHFIICTFYYIPISNINTNDDGSVCLAYSLGPMIGGEIAQHVGFDWLMVFIGILNIAYGIFLYSFILGLFYIRVNIEL